MTTGFIFLHRCILDHSLWQRTPFSQGQAWIDLLMLAAFRQHTVRQGRTLQRGQIWTSLRHLGERWGWGKDPVARFIGRLAAEGMLTIQCDRRRDTGGTLISIVNYDLYQASERDTERDETETQPRHKTRRATRHEPHSQTCREARLESRQREGKERDYKKEENKDLFPCASSAGGGDGNPKAASILNGGDVWRSWVNLNRARGRVDPARVGPDLKAAKGLAEVIPQERLPEILSKYLDDSDSFLLKQGHPLRLLPGRVNAYLNGTAELDRAPSPEELAATLSGPLPEDVAKAYGPEVIS